MSVKVIPKKTVTIIEPKKSLIVDKEKFRQKRVAAYCRVSTDSEEQLTSYKTQKKVYTEMIAENPEWEFAGLYADEGISGTRADKRPEFQKMIKDCICGKIDMVITKSVSRFARNTVECLEYVRLLKARGIGIFFEEQKIDTLKADSELYLVIYAGFAQSESESMSKNITWAYRKNFENGRAMFNFKHLLGYRRGEDGEPVIIPEEAEVVKEIYALFISGKTIAQISEIIQSRNYSFPDKQFTFQRSMIISVLKNEKYTGDVVLQKTVSVDCITKTRKRNQGEAPMYLVQNNHPAIISHKTFNKAQEEFAKRNTICQKTTRGSVTLSGKYTKYALSDVLICGECGTRYRRCTWVRGDQKIIVWRCISRLEHGKKYCTNSPTVIESALHEAVMRAVKRFSCEDGSTYLALMKATISEALGLSGSSDEADLLHRKIDALNGRMLAIVSESVSNGGSFDECEDEFRNLNDQINQLKSRIEVINKCKSADSEYERKIRQINEVIESRKNNPETYDDSIVRQMIECIKVYPDRKLEVYFGGDYMVEEHL